MDPELIFFIIRSLIRVGTATRDALEQKARDKAFPMPPMPYPVATPGERFVLYFNTRTGSHPEYVTKPDGPLKAYWIQDATTGGTFVKSAEAYAALLTASEAIKRQMALDAGTKSWIALRNVDEEMLTGVLAQWSDKDAPTAPWARIALALADVALDYVGSNPSILGVGGNGETLIKAVCSNLQACLPDVANGPQAFFVERMGVAILQAGFKTLTDNPNLVISDKATADVVGKVAKPLADLFASAGTDPSKQLTWINIRDTVFPEMVSAGLSALADHEQELLGTKFDPNDTLGYFTKGFLQALAEEPVWSLGTPKAWLPVYQSLLRAAAAKPNLLVKGTTANDKAIQDLVTGLATNLAGAPLPYTKTTVLGLAQVVVDELEKEVPTRSKDPWVLIVPAALQAVVDGLKKGGTSVGSLAQDELNAVIRVILRQAAATPGMIVGNGSSVEVQAIIASIATAMAADDRFLISEDGWTQIAAAAASAAAKNPGKLFGISDATPETQLATKLISKLLSNAAAAFGTKRSANAVLFGDTLVAAIEDTLTAAAGNAKGAAENVDQIGVLVDRLNKLAVASDKPIGAADWSWLYRNLVADAFDKGSVTFTDDQLRRMLFDHRMPGN